jgi:hypothetical protein
VGAHTRSWLIRRLFIVLGLIVLAIVLGRYIDIGEPVKKSKLAIKLEKINRIDPEDAKSIVSCAQIAGQKPIVILAIGEANAANHGARAGDRDVPITVIAEGKCTISADPLPGATGAGGSIWYRVPRYLTKLVPQRPIVFSVLAVEDTLIADWTDTASPLRARLNQRIQSMQTLGLAPQLVLWQQGESDAHDGTTALAYSAALDKLAGLLDQAKVSATIVLAESTVCRSAPEDVIRKAIEAKVTQNTRFTLGPDTDYEIHAGYRSDQCHISAEGLNRAGQLWAETIAPLVQKR